MNRRRFFSVVAVSPILSSLPVVDNQDDSEKEIVAFKAHYTDYVKEISYRFNDGTESTEVYDSREEWFNEVISNTPKFGNDSPPCVTTLCDATLRMASARKDYCHSFYSSGEYEIQIHTGLEAHPLYYVECYTDIREDVDRFDADSYAELTSKLADRNALFQ